jgi:magnesium chelatase family protein
VQRYRSRISGPLLDRLDVQIEVPAIPYRELAAGPASEGSHEVRSRVVAARSRQLARYRRRGPRCNAELTSRDIDRHCRLDAAGASLLESAVERLRLSARAYARVLKVARTVADLAGRDAIASEDVAEALQYRMLDRCAS